MSERALDLGLARIPTADKALKSKLLEAYFKLEAFSDARAALRALKRRGHKTGTLSNGSPAMLKGAVDAAGIGSDLDAVLSANALKAFKPRPNVYWLVTDHFRYAPGDVTFVSFNRWDVMAGVSVGFRGLWVNRSKNRMSISMFHQQKHWPISVLCPLRLTTIRQGLAPASANDYIRYEPQSPDPCRRSFP